jgi:hypothetical protein
MLAKAGWYNGNPSAVMQAPTDEVIDALYYEKMTKELEKAFYEMNKENQ